MAKENWSILSEYTIYKYMMERYESSALRLKPIYVNGQSYKGREKYKQVKYLKPIGNSIFPDIDEITIEGASGCKRPAEVKYLTSQFDYHSNKKYTVQFNNFQQNKGMIIVYKHDQIPTNLYSKYKADIYELDQDDFVGYVKINFDRLFFAQVMERKNINIWLMYAGRTSNFYNGLKQYNIEPAYKTGLWSPKVNISSMELNVNDIILFIKTGGIKQQDLQKYFYSNSTLVKNWFIEDIFLCKAKSAIMDRSEFYMRNPKYKKVPFLWADEGKTQTQKYNRVFKFDITTEFRNINLNLEEMRKENQKMVEMIYLLFTKQQEKLISLEEYNFLLEYIAKNQYEINKSTHQNKLW